MQTAALLAVGAFATLANAYQAGYPIGVLNNEVGTWVLHIRRTRFYNTHDVFSLPQVACPGVAIPANGIYAAVSSVESTAPTFSS